MRIESMNRAAGSSKIKAFFDIVTEEGIIIKGFKIAEGTKGLFVGVPSEQDKKDKTKYWDRVILPKEMKEELNRSAIAEYAKLGGESGSRDMDFPPPSDDMPF
jgi:stage V sporulation protein G